MSMKKCKECGNEVSSKAKICPQCGAKLKKVNIPLIIIGVILIIIGIGIAGSGSTTPTTTNSTTSASTSVVTKENYDKIQSNMTESEVKAILGEPKTTSENEIAGTKTQLWHYQETLGLQSIDIYISNGKVFTKNWTNLKN